MCHGDIEEATRNSKFVHAVMNDENACSKCHSPHGSDERGIILQQEKELCLSCHGRTYTTESGKTENIKQKLKEGNTIHAPADESCIICHSPHASNYVSVLKSNFPEGNYAEAKPENFAICFECHDPDLLTAEFTEYTGFRHGNKNMHFLHISGEKGRSCNTCHDSHGTKNNFLIKGKVPFGNWEMDMNFIVSENGGSCATGCHAKKEYDRSFEEVLTAKEEEKAIPVLRYQNYTEHIQEIDSSVIKMNERRKRQQALLEDSLRQAALAQNADSLDNEDLELTIIQDSADTKDYVSAELADLVKTQDSSINEVKDVPIIEVIDIKEKEFKITEFQAILFEFSEEEVSEESLPSISLVAEYLIRNPRLIVELHGHTDNIGDADFNMELSLLRANNVKKILENYGVRSERIKAKGFGGTKPLISNANESMRAKNRRVEFIISSKEQ
ncbi:MAG: hypothetical protein C0597_09990 [Marinilabiliales bacterium]|nr:MAG: hypothetical protein C0597_09990 [Marinilabiliales bacterium]